MLNLLTLQLQLIFPPSPSSFLPTSAFTFGATVALFTSGCFPAQTPPPPPASPACPSFHFFLLSFHHKETTSFIPCQSCTLWQQPPCPVLADQSSSAASPVFQVCGHVFLCCLNLGRVEKPSEKIKKSLNCSINTKTNKVCLWLISGCLCHESDLW